MNREQGSSPVELIRVAPVTTARELRRGMRNISEVPGVDLMDAPLVVASHRISPQTVEYAAVVDVGLKDIPFLNFLRKVAPNYFSSDTRKEVLEDWDVADKDDDVSLATVRMHEEMFGLDWSEFMQHREKFMETIGVDTITPLRFGRVTKERQPGDTPQMEINYSVGRGDHREMYTGFVQVQEGYEIKPIEERERYENDKYGYEISAPGYVARGGFIAVENEPGTIFKPEVEFVTSPTTVKQRNAMKPLMRWRTTESAETEREWLYDLPHIAIADKLGLITESSDTLLGLLAVAHFSPEVTQNRRIWPKKMGPQYIGAAQVPLLAEIRSNYLLSAHFVSAMERHSREAA